jgi:hypothetical protein
MHSQFVTKFEGSPPKDAMKPSQPTNGKKEEKGSRASHRDLNVGARSKASQVTCNYFFVSYLEEGRETTFTQQKRGKKQ